MNGIMGFTDMVLDTELDGEQLDYAKTIKRSGESLLSLLNDILDFSKIEAGELEFEEIDFDPEIIAYDVCDLIRPKTDQKPIEIQCYIGDNVPSWVRGDPLRFRQVLTNLMGNALKFTESGEIELSLDVDDEKDDRIKIHARIRDTGIGIPKEKLSTIFQSFHQADGSITRKYGGTGLGLSICKHISNLMGGDVYAESEHNKGSIFHFTAWFGKSDSKKSMRHSPVLLTGKKLLVIDDNLTSLRILKHMLESAGIDVIAIKDGRDVIAILEKAHKEKKPFDLCITDIFMSSMSGYELAREIRSWEEGLQNRGAPEQRISRLPLVAISFFVNRNAKECQKAGFDGFLSKPIRKENLFRRLERLFGMKEDEGHKSEIERDEIITQYTIKDEMKHSVSILLAEDNPVNQKLAQTMLTKAGYNLELATNGEEVVEKYTTSPEDFDLILMDIRCRIWMDLRRQR